MRTIETKAYTINELSEEAKETAHENYLQTKEYIWLDEWIETLKAGLEEFHYELKNYSIDPHFPGRSNVKINFTGNDDLLQMQGIRLWKYLRANGYEYIQNHYTKELESIHDDTFPLTGYCGDVDFLNPIKKFMERPDDSMIRDLIEDCIESILQGIREDVEFQDSLEFFIEECEANNFEFTENGKLI